MTSAPTTDAVRDAYASLADRYIDLFDTDVTDQRDEADLVRRHLTGLDGRVLDLGCGPGQWTAFLHAEGVDVTGVDPVPAFVAHARTAHPGPPFLLGSLATLDAAPGSVAGVLAWYSLIHLPPDELDDALGRVRRLLGPGGTLVMGFFDSEDGVAPFDHAVTTAYRWPVDALAARLAAAGLPEVERLSHRTPERPDRLYAAVAARAH